jgi:cytochrome P450
VSIVRKALKDFTFSDGTFIPKGTMIGVASESLHHDEKFYENANVFEPFRFAEMHEEDPEGANYQFISTAIEYLPFGHGKRAWCVVFISSSSTDS